MLGEFVIFKGRHFDQSVILLCVRWYLAYNLSLRDLEEMMVEHGVSVDHSTVHRWVVRFAPQLLEHFSHRKRTVTGKWHLDQTYITGALQPTQAVRHWQVAPGRNLHQGSRSMDLSLSGHR